MTDDDARAHAHVEGYLVGAHGRPCAVPLYGSLVLRRAWIRGWQIGRSRMPQSAPATPVDDTSVVAVQSTTTSSEDP